MNINTLEVEKKVKLYTFTFLQDGSDTFYIDMVSDSNDVNNSNTIIELMLIFSTKSSFNEINNINYDFHTLQKMTPQLKKQLTDFFTKFTKKDPKVFKIISKIKKIDDNKYFCVFPYKLVDDIKTKMFLWYYLESANKFTDEHEISESVKKKFEDFQSLFDLELEKYKIQNFAESESKTVIGIKPNNENGDCRFCKLTPLKGAQFSKVAHTISEALGNKKIITLDECDNCNEKFGTNLEPHLIKYLDFLRTYYQIKGKNGIPKIKFKNGEIFIDKEIQDGKEVNKFVITSNDITDSENMINVKLQSYDKINRQKIFKSLCKYALSVLDHEDLKYFEETIDWVQKEQPEGEIEPQLSIAKIFMQSYSSHPSLTIYIRKDDNDSSLPHVIVELFIGTMNIIYILPFSSKDHNYFSIEHDFSKLFKVFPRYEITKEKINFEDMSCSVEKPYEFNINIEKNS